MELTKTLANIFVLACLGGAAYLIYYIQELNSKIREARRKEVLNEVDEEARKIIEDIRSRPLADLVAKANERIQRIRRDSSEGDKGSQ
jgi:hypothetical protein